MYLFLPLHITVQYKIYLLSYRVLYIEPYLWYYILHYKSTLTKSNLVINIKNHKSFTSFALLIPLLGIYPRDMWVFFFLKRSKVIW